MFLLLTFSYLHLLFFSLTLIPYDSHFTSYIMYTLIFSLGFQYSQYHRIHLTRYSHLSLNLTNTLNPPPPVHPPFPPSTQARQYFENTNCCHIMFTRTSFSVIYGRLMNNAGVSFPGECPVASLPKM